MLTDLYSFVVSDDMSGLDADRAAAIATIRSMIGTQMYPLTLREGTVPPALTYQLIDNGADHTLDGANDGLFHPRVQIDGWALRYVDLITLSDAVRIALDGFIGFIGPGLTDVNVLIWDNEMDTYEPDRKEFRKTLDFRVIHN